MDREQIKQLIADLEASKLQKIIIKKGDFELHLEKQPPAPIAPMRAVVAENAAESAFQAEISQKGERGGSRKAEAEGTFVTSPMVGTFYSSPGPDEAPFVKVGDKVEIGSVVCIIEAMKVMNEVKASASGMVAEILADNAQPVEFGSKLLRITQ